MENKTYTFTAKVGKGELYRFHLYSVYCNFQGVLAIILSVLMAVICVMTWGKSNAGVKILLIAAAAYYPIYKPVALYIKSGLQANTESFIHGLTYTIDSENITVQVGEETAAFSWNDVQRVVERKKEVYIYTGKLFAYIISREQGGEELEGVLTMLHERRKA